MSGLALPKKLAANRANAALCRRIGVCIDGEDMGDRVMAYDVDAGVATLLDGTTRLGRIAPYWRAGKARS